MKELNVEEAVRMRYEEGAKSQEKELCCPVDYDPKYLKVIPAEIIERDYGCGDPSKYLQPGETVLDLGSGAGKICYIASQVVGPKGQVIGVDFNPEMLKLAEQYQTIIGDQMGYHNVEFRRGKIQDLKLNLGKVEAYLAKHPVCTFEDYLALEEFKSKSRMETPLIANNSIDVIVSNCVLNLVRQEDKQLLFKEMFRVLKQDGRAVISDIVSDKPIPEKLQQDPYLWTGCISGAFQEEAFLQAFEEAGFCDIELLAEAEEPFRVIDGIVFRSVTVAAYKGEAPAAGSCCGSHGCC